MQQADRGNPEEASGCRTLNTYTSTPPGKKSAGTDSNRLTLIRRTGLRLRNGMTPAAKCRRLATMLRAKAEQERDPEIRAEWNVIARGYLILARVCTHTVY
jgi:hypothetical protein